MKIAFVFEAMMYFFCLSAIIRNIFHCTTKKLRYFTAFSTYFCTILPSLVFLNDDTFIVLHMIFLCIEILALYFAFYNAKLFSIIYAYISIYCVNTIVSLSVALVTDTSLSDILWIDFFVICILNISCTILCFTNVKEKLCQFKDWTPLSAKRLLLLLLIFSMYLISFILDKSYYTNSNLWFQFVQKTVLIVVILLLIIMGALVYIMFSNNQLKQLTKNYEEQIHAQAEHYRLLSESNFEMRKFKHDFKNMSIAIETLLAARENERALQLFKQYNQILGNSDCPSAMFDTGNGIVDSLLTDKNGKALACNAKIIFEGSMPAKRLSPTDICVILGNTLDNAIEACEKLKTEELSVISVTAKCSSGFLFLSISNPVSEKVHIRNNHIATTKEDKMLHGFGLYSLNSVVRKYDGRIELDSTENTFSANIDLCLMNIEADCLCEAVAK